MVSGDQLLALRERLNDLDILKAQFAALAADCDLRVAQLITEQGGTVAGSWLCLACGEVRPRSQAVCSCQVDA